jgi:anti-sigma regulatory factor (Ser/Thr protein kinase)
VTELFANAIAYTSSGRPGGAVTVAIRIAGDGAAVVTVLDEGSPEAPLLPVPAGGLAEHGRGLVLVDALTDGWGTAPDPGGRSVWFCCAWERP